MAVWHEGHLPHKNSIQLIPRGSVWERVEERTRRNQLTQIYLEKWPLNGIITNSSSNDRLWKSCGMPFVTRLWTCQSEASTVPVYCRAVCTCRHFTCLCVLKALRSRVDSSISSADSRQTSDHSTFTSAVTDQQEYVTSTVSSLTASMQQMSDKLHQRAEDVDHFLSTELQQDVPTGNTTYWSPVF